MPCRLTVNIREFTLTDEHATTVSDSILTTVRDGGGYVHLTPIGSPETDILVTASTTIAFERLRTISPAPAPTAEEIGPDSYWPDDYL